MQWTVTLINTIYCILHDIFFIFYQLQHLDIVLII